MGPGAGDHDFPTLLRRLVSARGLSQRALARQVPIDPGQLSRVINGKRRPTPELAARCDQILGSGDQLVRAARAGLWAPDVVQGFAADVRPGDIPPLDVLDADEGRRALLSGLALVATGAGLFTPTDLAGRHLGPGDVTRIEAVTTLYRSMDYEYGGGALVDDVGHFAEAASALLDATYSGAVAPRLHTAVAGARQLAGWTAFDAGRHADAQRHFLAAERAAVSAGDALLAARIRYCQARQFQHLRHNTDALATLRLAREQLGGRATPAVTAMLHGARAASLAAIGDRDGAFDALGAAHDAFEASLPEKEPDWMHFFDRGELLAQHGRVYRDLARADRSWGAKAVDAVREAIAAFGPQNVRSTALNEVGLCSALFLSGEPEEALVVGRRVAERASRLTSRRLHDRITNIRRDLGSYLEVREVHEFAVLIASA